MNRIIRWYNQNREMFFAIIAVISFAIIIIHTLNSLALKKQEEKRNNVSEGNSGTNSTTISRTDESVITGKQISQSDDEDNTKVIRQFIEYCNDGEIQKAYSMLSNECKEKIYPSLEYFTNNYYKKIFYMNRMYDLENWYTSRNRYTYYIKYTEDALATGKVNSENNRSDYITVEKDNNQYYLNISNYIGREKRNKINNIQNIKTTINYIDMYMDYTILNITIKNNTDKTICIDTKESTDTAYLYDDRSVKYTAFLNEIAKEQLVIRKGEEINISIKYNKIYKPERENKGLIFSDVVLNYDEYTNGKSKKEKIKLDLSI